MPAMALKKPIKKDQAEQENSGMQELESLRSVDEQDKKSLEALIEEALEAYRTEGEEQFRELLSIQHQ